MSESTLRLVEEIRAKIRRLARRITLADLAYGGLLTAGVVAGMLVIATLIESAFWLPSAARWAFLIVFLGSSAILLSWYIVRPGLILIGVLDGIDETEVARRVGREFPAVRDRLVNFLHLVSGRRSVAPEPLLDGAIAQLGTQLREPNYESVETFSKARGVGRVVALPVAGLLAFLLVDPPGFAGAASRLMAPDRFFARPAPFQLVVEPGDTEIVKGDSVDFRVRAEGAQLPEAVFVEIRRRGETRSKTVLLARAGETVFSHTERNVRDPFTYKALAGDVETRNFEVGVVARPFVRSFQVTVHPPAYTRLSPTVLASNVGDFAAYPGSRIEVEIMPSQPVSSARIEFDKAEAVALDVGSGLVAGSFSVYRDDTYRIRLVDESGLSNDEPIHYRIQQLVDEFPGIVVLEPDADTELTDDLMVGIRGRLSDDFGFSSLSLRYRLSQSVFGEPQEEFRSVELPRPEPHVPDQNFSYSWDLADIPQIDLVPGDVLEFYLEVRDNDRIGGFKRTASPVHTVRFPSLTEQYDQLADRQSEVEGELESLIEDSREVKESFEQLRDELRRKQDGDWDDQRQLQRLREQQSRLEEQAEALSNQVEEMVEQMQQHDLVSPQTLERFKELKRVVEEINSPELDEALERLRQAMEELDLSEIQRSLGEVEFNEEQFLERLERTLELFKRLRAEQKLEEAARRAGELAERQDQIRQKTEDLEEGIRQGAREDDPAQQERRSDEEGVDSDERPENEEADVSNREERDSAGELADEQERSSRDMEALEELLDDIGEELEEIESAPAETFEEMLERMEQQDLTGQMQENAQQIRRGALDKAQQGQRQMSQQLQQMSQQLQQMKEEMTGEQMRRNLAWVRQALDDVLTLSQEQEELRNEVREVASRDAGLRRFTQQQAELHEGLTTVGDSLVAMAREIPEMSREVQTHAGQASMDMSRAVEEMVERRGARAVAQQKSAMTNLNELALLLSDLMQNMQAQQGGMGGMSMQQMLQQLQQAAGEQARLNQQIQQLLNDMAGSRLSQDMGRRLQQMAAQQEALRRQLEEMGENAPSAAERLLGDLEQIARQMEESISEMKERNIDSRTVRRQQEILTRLLNAQRSIRERGKENRRKGRTAEDQERASPSELTPDRRVEQLRRELLDALESGYSADYEELIRRYFELLQELEGSSRGVE